MLFLKRFCLLLCVSVLFMSCKKVDKTMPPPVQIHPDIVKFDYVYNLMSDRFKSDVVIPQDEILDFVKKTQPKYHLFAHIHATADEKILLGKIICQNIAVKNIS